MIQQREREHYMGIYKAFLEFQGYDTYKID